MAETRYESSHTGQQIDDAVNEIINKTFLVNDLTTGGTNKALTAEQGKVLAQRVEESGGGMLVERTEDDYHVKFNFIDNSPALAVSVNSLVMGGDTKTATFKVSGQRLKGNINIGVVGTNFSLSHSQLSPTDGVVAETTITLTYSGTATATATITISSTGATSKTISAQYTEQQVPTIDIATDTITFKAGVGGTQTKTLLVKGYNLEGAIALAFVSNVGGRFTLSQNSFNPSGDSVNAQVTITYTPQSGDTGTFSATLRATSTNATSVDVPLVGKVSTLSVSKNSASVDSLSLATEVNTPVTETISVQGTDLNEGISISIDGTDSSLFGVQPSSITLANSSSPTQVTITYTPTATGTHTARLVITSSGITKYVTLGGEAEAATLFDDSTGHFNKNGIYYGAISDGNGGWTNNCKVYNEDYNTSSGVADAKKYKGTINIPAQVTAGGRTFNVTEIAAYAFYGCKMMNVLTLPEGLTTIGANAFYGWTNKSSDFPAPSTSRSVWELTIPSSVVSLGANFMYQCENIGSDSGGFTWADPSNANFPTTFPSNAFAYNKNLEEIVIPDKITTLKTEGSGASTMFTGCAKLKKITFGTDCTSYSNVLTNLSSIRTIIITSTSTTPLSGWGLHADIIANANVYVPSQAVMDAYTAHQTWGQISSDRFHLISDLSNS